MGISALALLLACAAFGPRLSARNGSPQPKSTFRGESTSSSGLMYVVDSEANGPQGRILVLDPSQGVVKAVISTGNTPDIALSPDGTKLYVSSSGGYDAQTDNLTPAILSTYDAASLRLISQVPNPDIIRYKFGKYLSSMVTAGSGRYIYMPKMHFVMKSAGEPEPSISSYYFYLATYDTVTERFLPNHVLPPRDCSPGLVFPGDRDLAITVACPNSRHIARITLDPSGSEASSTQLPLGDSHSDGRTKWKSAYQDPIEGLLVVLDADGLIYTFDDASETVAAVPQDFPAGGVAWTGMQEPVIPRGLHEVCFGAGPAPSPSKQDFEFYDRIVCSDSTSLAPRAAASTSMRFFSLAISKDGSTLYTLNPDSGSIAVIDTATLREIRRFPVGLAPIFARLAP